VILYGRVKLQGDGRGPKRMKWMESWQGQGEAEMGGRGEGREGIFGQDLI
jgi:hypothetical protein